MGKMAKTARSGEGRERMAAQIRKPTGSPKGTQMASMARSGGPAGPQAIESGGKTTPAPAQKPPTQPVASGMASDRNPIKPVGGDPVIPSKKASDKNPIKPMDKPQDPEGK